MEKRDKDLTLYRLVLIGWGVLAGVAVAGLIPAWFWYEKAFQPLLISTGVAGMQCCMALLLIDHRRQQLRYRDSIEEMRQLVRQALKAMEDTDGN